MTPTGEWLQVPKRASDLDVYWYLMSPGWPSSESLGLCYYHGDGETHIGKYIAPIYVSELEPGRPQKFKLNDSRKKLHMIKRMFLIYGSQ